MEEIKKILEKLLMDTGIETPVLQNRSLLVWSKVVGETIAKNSSAEEVKHGKLIVKVSTPVWRNELILRKKEILEKLNKALGKKVIKDIKLL